MGVKVELTDFTLVNQARKEILAYLDQICRDNSLEYFAFAKLLVGTIYYQDFIPNGLKSSVEIGLMRRDYDRLVQILTEQMNQLEEAEEKDESDQDTLEPGAVEMEGGSGIEADEIPESDTVESPIRFRVEYAHNIPAFQCRVIKDIQQEADGYLLKGNVEVIVSAFDYVPESEAIRKVFYRKIFFKCRKYRKDAKSYPKNSNKILSLSVVKGKILRKVKYNKKRISRRYQKILNMASAYADTTYIRRLIPTWSQELPYEDIFPTRRAAFEDIEINIPANHNYWAFEIDEELMERTRAIQKIDLAIIREFDRVCRKIGVHYFICGGTMLGYMRHGGFIPWDDDMDVGMLRSDYDRFLAEAPRYLNSEDFFLQTRQTDRKIPYLFSKIRMNETEYITHYNELRDFHKGICLDLFPFDYIPNDPDGQKAFRAEVRRVEKIHNLVVNKQKEKPVFEEPARDFEEKKARFINELRRKITHLIPLELTQKLYIRTATRYNAVAKERGLTTVASFVPTYTYDTIEDMIPYQDVMFEGVQVMALKDMDKFLTMQYGDYMELPQMHQRVGHDLISWSISDRMAAKYHIYDEEEE